MYSFAINVTLAALTIASAASTEPMSPLVSMRPNASFGMRCRRGTLTDCGRCDNPCYHEAPPPFTIRVDLIGCGTFAYDCALTQPFCGPRPCCARRRDERRGGLRPEGDAAGADGNAEPHAEPR